MRTIILSSLLLSVVLASALQTLDSDEDLKKTGFGLRPHHHGLRLLKWYVKTCLGNNMKALCNPEAGAYGFHLFVNGENLLPRLPEYFSIGNLYLQGDKRLPYDLRKDYDWSDPETNMDRVLVKYDPNTGNISDIFIYENYKKAYMIGPKLLATLRGKKHV